MVRLAPSGLIYLDVKFRLAQILEGATNLHSENEVISINVSIYHFEI